MSRQIFSNNFSLIDSVPDKKKAYPNELKEQKWFDKQVYISRSLSKTNRRHDSLVSG